MKKKLLMAAVGAALCAGPVIAAHAAGATLYGHMHMSFDRLDNDNGIEDGRMSNNSSRFGIKGDEDLGGGLKAIYQLESNIVNIDDGVGGLAGTPVTNTGFSNGAGSSLRNTFVGFAGSWGTVKLGRHDTAFKDLGRKLDNFNEQVGDMRNAIGASTGWDNRVSNMIRYESPSFSGLNVVVQHTSNDGSEALANSSQKDNSLGVNWSAGPLFLGAAWNEQGTGTTTEESGIRLAGAYTFNNIMLGLLWESLSDMGGVSGTDRDAMGFVAAMTMGNNKFKFHYLDADKTDNAATPDGAKLWAIGVDHTFSKTAMVYLNYASVDNDTGAAVTTTSSNGGHGETLATTGGKSPTGISTGVILKF
jgi:predicted porin